MSFSKFIDYLFGFYNRSGFYTSMASRKEIEAALIEHVTKSELDYIGDSYDREKVSEILLTQGLLTK
tara:strand:- start:21 stop:221 length:201 start_codon:yes stop_codon:yes gene_type:complete